MDEYIFLNQGENGDLFCLGESLPRKPIITVIPQHNQEVDGWNFKCKEKWDQW